MPSNHDFQANPSNTSPTALKISPSELAQAQRHLQRAKEQVKLKNFNLAVQELKDAIQIDSENSEYHALMAKIHLDRDMTGMANISVRQALKLNPEDAIALDCQKRLKQKEAAAQRQQNGGGFLGGLFGGRK